MRPSRTAVGLAIMAAISAPFVAGTSEPRANAQSWVALTAGQRAEITAKLDSSKNCRYFETQVEARDVLGLKVDSKDIDDAMECHRDQDALRDGGVMQAAFSLPRYLAINGGVALTSALAVLGLAVMFSALLRHSRRRLGSRA
jgi:hypothetical protein